MDYNRYLNTYSMAIICDLLSCPIRFWQDSYHVSSSSPSSIPDHCRSPGLLTVAEVRWGQPSSRYSVGSDSWARAMTLLPPSYMTSGKSFDFLIFSSPFCTVKMITGVLWPKKISFNDWIINLSPLTACKPWGQGSFLNVKKKKKKLKTSYLLL